MKCAAQVFLTASLLLASLSYAQSKTYTSAGQKFSYQILTQQKEIIWGFDFLPDGRILFTERSGRLSAFDPLSKKVTEITGVPKVWAEGQGGLLDVRVHPTRRSEIYFTYASPEKDGGATALGTATLASNKLTNFKRLFVANRSSKNGEHFGSRIEFDGQGHVFFTIGDRNERKYVQDLGYHMGKVIRLKEDGSVPADNPFVNDKKALPEIWALGIRSPQGLAINPETKDLWEAEMGPRGGDEVNIIQKGKNYGWPIVTFGREYWGPKIGEGTEKKSMESPVAHWVPSISPSALAFYTGNTFPQWKNNIFLANLSGQHLLRLVIKDNKVVQQEELLKNEDTRFRNVRTGPDGNLYFSTDDGKIARISPAK